ncbi:MAG: aldo/keto reductase [Desulfobacterales bacterium]
MKQHRLGKTELMVSEVGFGGIPIIPLSMDEGAAVVRHCFERGITFFDTANAYGDSEKKVGLALEGVRNQVVIATKTGRRDAEGAAKHLQFSLDNLRTDYIDIYQFHNVSDQDALDTILAPGGAMETAKAAQEDGRIKFISFSSHNIDTALATCRTGHFATVQFPFNFIETEPADELFVVARELDIGIIAMKPLGGGLIARADLCFRFLQQHPYVLPDPGFKTKEEVDEIIDLYLSRQAMTAQEEAEIETIRAESGTRFCRRCGYCIPCDQGVNIPQVMSFQSQAKRFPPDIVKVMAKGAMDTVDKCTTCGDCLEKCPYHLQIPDLLQENLNTFQEFVTINP